MGLGGLRWERWGGGGFGLEGGMLLGGEVVSMWVGGYIRLLHTIDDESSGVWWSV